MTQLYRHFSVDNKLMYVGISLNTFARLSQHKNHSKWFSSITRVHIEHFKTREEAMAAERTAIKTELPMFNIAMKKTIKEIEQEQKLEQKQKQIELEQKRKQIALEKCHLTRNVLYHVAYSLDDIKPLLSMTTKEIDAHIEGGRLSVFHVEKRPSWKTGEVKFKTLVSGWSLIDFIGYLEAKSIRKAA